MRKIFFSIFLFASFLAKAQDPQFSQYYAISCYSNPAMAGNIDNMKFALQHRRQWMGMDGTFTTTLADAEFYKKSISSGFAVLYMQDLQASSTFSQSAFHVMYSRQMQVAYKTFLRFGIDLAYNTLSLDKTKLHFVNQFSEAGPVPGVTGEPLTQLMTFYPTFGAGLALSGASYFFGAALHDLNQPNASFFKGNTTNKVPMEININGGYNFLFFTKHGGFEGRPYRAGGIAPAGSVTAAFNFKKQGDFQQFDAGVFTNYYPMTFGLWYRGLPFSSVVPGTINNNDALIFILGMTIDNIRIGYSYDLTISDMFGTSPGSHELTLVYEIPAKPKGRSKSSWTSPPVSCPSF